MVEENKDIPNDDLYGRLSELHPSRGGGETKEKGLPDDGSGSLTQRMKLSPKRSDIQVVDERLFPVLKETLKWLDNLMIGRVFPEQQIPLKRIIGKHLLKEYPDMSVAEATVIADVAVSVPIDGEGRMDIIHLFTKMTEKSEDEDKKARLI